MSNVGFVQLEQLNNDQVYYFKAGAVKRGLESTISNAIMTIPSEDQVPQSLYTNISADGKQYTPSPDGRLVTFVGKKAGAVNGPSNFLNYYDNQTAVVKSIDQSAFNVGWNNQSDMIAYTKLISIDQNNNSYQFKIFDVDNEEEIFELEISQNSNFSNPVFSPDDTKVYFLEARYSPAFFFFNIYELDLVTFDFKQIVQ